MKVFLKFGRFTTSRSNISTITSNIVFFGKITTKNYELRYWNHRRELKELAAIEKADVLLAQLTHFKYNKEKT